MNRRTLIVSLVTAVLLVLGIGPAAVHSQAPATVYVDKDNTSGTENGSITYPFRTIAAGTGLVASGGTVLVAPGIYQENVVISRTLTLRGSGLDMTTIDGNGVDSAIRLGVTGITVTVEHFRISGGGPQYGDAGLKSASGSTIVARWNWLAGNGYNGVISYGPDVIERNLFTNNGDGAGSGRAIWASANSTARIHNNTIRRTTYGDASDNRVGAGIAMYDYAGQKAAPDIRNNIICDVYEGIHSQSGSPSPATQIDYNIVFGNTTNYSNGVIPGANDQSVDPRLTTTSYLNTGSPAIDVGDPDPAFNDRDGSRNDVGMRQYHLTGAPFYGSFATESAWQPSGLAAYLGSAVWVSSYMQEPGIYRLDAANGDPLQTIKTGLHGSYYGGLAYAPGPDVLFHSSSRGIGIHLVDRSTGRIESTLPFTVSSGSDLAFDNTHLWQIAGGSDDPRIYKISADDGSVVGSAPSPVPGQTQTFGLTYGGDALWLSRGQEISKIDPFRMQTICSFDGPLSDARGLAWIPGNHVLASSFTGDKVMRFDLPEGCSENTQPIDLQWSPQETQTLRYQPIYSNEAACVPGTQWQSRDVQSGDLLPKDGADTVRGVRFQMTDPSVVVTGTQLLTATLTRCADDLWAAWSDRPATWAQAAGTLEFDWHPRPRPGIKLEWKGDVAQTIRYQHRVANEDVCAPRNEDWSNVTLEAGDYLPLASNPAAPDRNYSGLRLHLAPGDELSAEGSLDPLTDLTSCGDGLWTVWSTSPSAFSRAYGTVTAGWSQLQQEGLVVSFPGAGGQLPHAVQWQGIADGEPACGDTGKAWYTQTLQSGDALPLGGSQGIRLKVDRGDLLNIQRVEGVRTQKCGGGMYAVYGLTATLWERAIGTVIIDWGALLENLGCTWMQHTETVDHARHRNSHLWCDEDGTVTLHYENGTSGTVDVVDGHAQIPANVDSIQAGGTLGGQLLTATLKGRLDVTMHLVPVNLVDVGIDSPSIDIFLIPLDMANLPFFDVTYVVEEEIDVEGDTQTQIWNNMETAMNGQPAVVGSDAYMLVASSADEPVDYEKWFGQGPFDTWKGMFFLEHPTTFIHELLHSLLGLRHVGSGPGPDPDWPYGATDTFPEEATYWGNTQTGTWERLHFTGDDCDALMSYGNSNPYDAGDYDHRVRCLSPFTAGDAWSEVGGFAVSAAGTRPLADEPVMWLEGPDLFRFSLAHTTGGDTGTGPLLSGISDGAPFTVTVPSYKSDVGHFVDSFVTVPGGVITATFDGRDYPTAMGTLSGTEVVSDTIHRTLAVTTTCGWLLSTDDGGGERLVSGPHVGSRTVNVSNTEVNLQLSCSDGESTQSLDFPVYLYLPAILRQ